MQIVVNDKASQLPDNSTIHELLASKHIEPESVMVCINGEIVGRNFWKTSMLKYGDNVEIIRIVGGG
jgi:sulfur carrier protein